MEEDILKKLNNKYFKIYGQSPEYSFWSWLDACGIEPNLEELERVYNDKSYWVKI